MRTNGLTSTMLIVLAAMLVFAATVPTLASASARVLVGFRGEVGKAEKAIVRNAGGEIDHAFRIVNVIAVRVPQANIAKLQANRNVVYVEEDGRVTTLDTELNNTWGVEHIGAGIVHGYNKGTDVKVAVIDTGIDHTHFDLDGNYAGGYDFVNNDTDPMDDHGHGTHVAGTVAAEDDDVGVVGAAPEATLYALKILDSEGRGYVSDLIAAIEWSMGYGFDFNGDGAIDEMGVEVDVINMSLGSFGQSSALEDACDVAYAKGIVLVAAAGNGGRVIPAAFDSVIAVAASDSDDKIPRWSSKGSYIELTAPGVAVNSTLLGGGYRKESGTSMASPHVAGTVALMIAGGFSNIRTTLQDTADKLMRNANAEYPFSWQGYGLVDADEAVPASTPAPPRIALTPAERLSITWGKIKGRY